MPNAPSSEHDRARRHAVEIVRTLRDHGHTAYLAGGCVRDELLGLTPTDYDVATDAEPGVITALFARTSEVGAAFGVVLVHHGPGRVTEVATFRKDFEYGDKRRPDRVEFTDAEHDAQRRDFTINALFLDPLESDESKQVIDHVGGVEDLSHRVVRAVGDPNARLNEDHLRALRAVRFACRLGFELDPATAAAIRMHAADLTGVSRERIGDEMRKMLIHPSRVAAAGWLQALGLDAPTLDEPTSKLPPVVLAGLPEAASFPLALAAWAIDRHGEGAACSVPRWRAAMCLSNDERDAVERILAMLDELRGPWFVAPVAGQKRAAAAAGFAEAQVLLGIIEPMTANRVSARIDELRGVGMGLWPEPFLDGEVLIELGMDPGPSFARILNGVYDAQLDGRVMDRAAAERLARELSVAPGVESVAHPLAQGIGRTVVGVLESADPRLLMEAIQQ
ncbi:MAG: CCA tRNA nucleotidyltransferase [Phycisphaerales bacterium]|nr:CCA tRNA nucleotidyltransferase [Phycisphaerales bacterium]